MKLESLTTKKKEKGLQGLMRLECLTTEKNEKDLLGLMRLECLNSTQLLEKAACNHTQKQCHAKQLVATLRHTGPPGTNYPSLQTGHCAV